MRWKTWKRSEDVAWGRYQDWKLSFFLLSLFLALRSSYARSYKSSILRMIAAVRSASFPDSRDVEEEWRYSMEKIVRIKAFSCHLSYQVLPS